jgi:hypothetical protein
MKNQQEIDEQIDAFMAVVESENDIIEEMVRIRNMR